ncbi:MAG: GNAT family N-acetyltransferase [Bacteroidales bacterium]|nr:GNAT family N-acetyltransferase [Bacteroidales bacterium]
MKTEYSIRFNIDTKDPGRIRQIVTSSGFFSREEIEIAVELAEERLEKGPSSGYEFVFLDQEEQTLGYTCYGLIPGTKSSYHLYWIAVDDKFRHGGFGKQLLQITEKQVKKSGGSGLYAETSGRDQYEPTRAFYLHNGYEAKARFEDYYDQGDDLVYFVKKI